MTPLEKAKTLCCKNCHKREVVGSISYCSVNGKILLPSLLEMCVCHGEGLKEKQNGKNLEELKAEVMERHGVEVE